MSLWQPSGGRVSWLWCVVALGLASACDETGPRVYTGERYQPDRECVEPYAPLGLVQTDELAANCAPVCLRVAEALYVSSVCAPYPLEASLEEAETSPECAAALGADADAAQCGEDGSEDPDAGPNGP